MELTMLIDMTAMDEVIGTGFAIASLGRQSRYIQDLITASAQLQEHDFNREVAAFAAATGKLGHMFEWGTVGINTSKSNMTFDPMSPSARLWRMNIEPGRKWTNLSYTFEPSVAVVPKPPAAKTGIPEDVLDKLNDHIFWNKAMVMETGMEVTIKPKSSNARGLLFVPNVWNNGEQGYSMYATPTSPDVSGNTQGTFTIFFLDYWERTAPDEMDKRMQDWVDQDMKVAVREIKADKKITTPKIDRDGMITLKADAVRKRFERAAKARLGMTYEN